jgi:hypothetical protein
MALCDHVGDPSCPGVKEDFLRKQGAKPTAWSIGPSLSLRYLQKERALSSSWCCPLDSPGKDPTAWVSQLDGFSPTPYLQAVWPKPGNPASSSHPGSDSDTTARRIYGYLGLGSCVLCIGLLFVCYVLFFLVRDRLSSNLLCGPGWPGT